MIKKCLDAQTQNDVYRKSIFEQKSVSSVNFSMLTLGVYSKKDAQTKH